MKRTSNTLRPVWLCQKLSENPLEAHMTMDTTSYLAKVALLFTPDATALGDIDMRAVFDGGQLRSSSFTQEVNGKTGDFSRFLTEAGVPTTIDGMTATSVTSLSNTLKVIDLIRKEKDDDSGTDGVQADVNDDDLFDKLVSNGMAEDDINILLSLPWVRAGLREYGRTKSLELKRTGDDWPEFRSGPEITIDDLQKQAAAGGMTQEQLDTAKDQVVADNTANMEEPVGQDRTRTQETIVSNEHVIHIPAPPRPPAFLAEVDRQKRAIEEHTKSLRANVATLEWRSNYLTNLFEVAVRIILGFPEDEHRAKFQTLQEKASVFKRRVVDGLVYEMTQPHLLEVIWFFDGVFKTGMNLRTLKEDLGKPDDDVAHLIEALQSRGVSPEEIDVDLVLEKIRLDEEARIEAERLRVAEEAAQIKAEAELARLEAEARIAEAEAVIRVAEEATRKATIDFVREFQEAVSRKDAATPKLSGPMPHIIDVEWEDVP